MSLGMVSARMVLEWLIRLILRTILKKVLLVYRLTTIILLTRLLIHFLLIIIIWGQTWAQRGFLLIVAVLCMT